MLVDAALTTTDLQAVPDAARTIEAAGYDGIYSFEGAHDGFFPLLLAAEQSITAEQVIDLLQRAWRETDIVRLRIVRLPSVPPSHAPLWRE